MSTPQTPPPFGGAQPLYWYEQNISQWRMEKGFITSKDNFMEKLMLIVTEVSEAAEAFRHIDAGDRSGLGWAPLREEIADTFIRLFDLCGSIPELYNIEAAIIEKMEKNTKRPWRHGKSL